MMQSQYRQGVSSRMGFVDSSITSTAQLARQPGFVGSADVCGTLGHVVFVMSKALGDTLVSMTIVHNLLRDNVPVTVLGNQAYALREWFPNVEIAALPPLEILRETLARFDTVIQMHLDQPVGELWNYHPRVLSLHDVEYSDRPGCMAERFARYCRDELGVMSASVDNGLSAPEHCAHRRHSRRIAIHPESSTKDNRWSSAGFLKLARTLKGLGYDVQFVIAPHERDRWPQLDAHDIIAPHFDNVGALAKWLYESGWFIGNDSGVGHLASNLGIPTISLFPRRRTADRWRPAWGQVRVVTAWQWIPFTFLRKSVWRHTVSCRRVLRAFLSVSATQTWDTRRSRNAG